MEVTDEGIVDMIVDFDIKTNFMCTLFPWIYVIKCGFCIQWGLGILLSSWQPLVCWNDHTSQDCWRAYWMVRKKAGSFIVCGIQVRCSLLHVLHHNEDLYIPIIDRLDFMSIWCQFSHEFSQQKDHYALSGRSWYHS